MVESWSVAPDQLLWRFRLRDGLAFHDDSPVTSADVTGSLTRWMKRDSLGLKVGGYVSGIVAVDAKTFEIHLSRPTAFLLWALGSGTGQIPAIMRARDLSGDPTKPVTTAIGSGPFRFNRDRWVSGSLVVFDRNMAYVPRAEPPDGLAGGRVVKVDAVEWRVMPDVTIAASALQTGEVDLIEAPSLDLVPKLRRSPDITVRALNSLNNQGILRANALFPPFNDPRARQALALLADQSDYMSAVAGDPENWAACSSYFICGGPYGAKMAKPPMPHANLEQARALLTAAGYRGEKLVFVATKDLPPIGQISEVAIDALQKAGVTLDVQWSDWGTMATRITKKSPPSEGGWNLFATYSSGITASNPMTNVGTNMACDGSNWNGWPCDAEAEKLRQAFIDAPGPATVQALENRLNAVAPFVPVGEFIAPVAYRSSLRGVLNSPVITYWNIEKA
jgi:peptide/nickel transport system substrate-binding protein